MIDSNWERNLPIKQVWVPRHQRMIRSGATNPEPFSVRPAVQQQMSTWCQPKSEYPNSMHRSSERGASARRSNRP